MIYILVFFSGLSSLTGCEGQTCTMEQLLSNEAVIVKSPKEAARLTFEAMGGKLYTFDTKTLQVQEAPIPELQWK